MVSINIHYGKPSVRWNVNGRTRRRTFADMRVAEVFKKQLELEAEKIKLGLVSPLLSVQPAVLPKRKTFAELCEYQLEYRTPHKRNKRTEKIIINKHLLPFFGTTYLECIDAQMIDQFTSLKKSLAPKTISHHLTLLGTMLNTAKDLKWLRETPKIKKPKIHFDSNSYRYLRTKEEVSRFLNAAMEEGVLVHALYATAVFTGLRQGELSGLKWSDIDFESRLITVQHSYESQTKSGRVRHVPILDGLYPILREWKAKACYEIVFPNAAGHMQLATGARIFDEVFKRTLDRGGFIRKPGLGRFRYHICFHDLRHSFASHWVLDGGGRYRIFDLVHALFGFNMTT